MGGNLLLFCTELKKTKIESSPRFSTEAATKIERYIQGEDDDAPYFNPDSTNKAENPTADTTTNILCPTTKSSLIIPDQ